MSPKVAFTTGKFSDVHSLLDSYKNTNRGACLMCKFESICHENYLLCKREEACFNENVGEPPKKDLM